MKTRIGAIAILLVIVVLIGAMAVLLFTPSLMGSLGSSTGGAGGDANFASEQQDLVAFKLGEDQREAPEAEADDSPEQTQTDERLIIKNGSVTLVVEDADVAAQQVAEIASDHGGYVLNSDAYLIEDLKSVTITITVRAEDFDAAMGSLRGIAKKVMRESSSGEDVTAEYIDLESRLRNLELTRNRLQGFMDAAQTVEEALAVSKELTTVEAEIEQVKGRMQYLRGRAALSTIRVDLEVEEALPITSDWSLGVTLRQAARAQTVLFRTLIEALVWLIVVPGPYLLVIALIVFGVRAYRRRNAKSAPIAASSPEEP